MLGRLSRNSIIYTLASLLQRGISFLLLPLYTRFLLPEDFGIISIVTVLNGFLAILFTFSAHGAITRFYFEFKDRPQQLREFLGTIIVFIIIASVVCGTAILLIGARLLAPVLGQIPFWPYVALGVFATIFQPLFAIYLSLLQTGERAVRYSVMSFLNFLANLVSIIALVVFAHLRASGPLLANAIVACVFFCVTLYLIREDVRLCLRRDYVIKALRYSLPLVPHNVAGQLQVIFDRFVLNRLAGPAAVGLYQVGYLFGGLLAVVQDAVNRAYVPVVMSVLSGGEKQDLPAYRELGLTMTAGFCLLAALIGMFAPEGVWLLTSGAYHDAAMLVPVFAYSFAAAGIYNVFVTVLFYETHATPFIMIATSAGAVTSIVCNLSLVPSWGVTGSVLSSLAAQSVTASVAAILGARFEAVAWPYARIACVFVGCLAITVLTCRATTPPSLLGCALKLPILLMQYAFCNFVLFGEANYLGKHMRAFVTRYIQRRGAQA